MDKFFQALSALLPTGFAWPRDSSSVLMRVIRGLAGSFSELHEFCAATVKQWQPATTINRLAEWEEATGLPDPCFTLPNELLVPGLYALTPAQVAVFSRASTGSYIDAAGVRKTAAVNVARYEGGKLVVEAAVTNLWTYSDLPSNAAWSKSGATIVDAAAVGADGTMSLSKLVESSATQQHRTFRTFVVEAGKTYSYSFDLRAGERTSAYVLTSTGSTVVSRTVATVDLLTGTYSVVAGGQIRVVGLANGVWRVTVTETTTGTTLQPNVYLLDPSGVLSYLGDGASGFYVGAAQLELDRGTSYIPTVAATVTRSADLAYVFPNEEASRNLRKKLLLTRLAGPGLAYPDSSSGSTAAIVAVCAWLGYTATVTYNHPFRCGRDRVGDRLGQLDGILYVNVVLQSTLFRVGTSRVGQRLAEGTMNGGELACYLQRVVPARFQINVIFS